jgi:signal transduction histidine kinase
VGEPPQPSGAPWSTATAGTGSAWTWSRPRKTSRRYGGWRNSASVRPTSDASKSLLFETAERTRRDVERAAGRTTRLQAITAALGRAVTPLEVAEVAIAEGAAALGASGGVLGLIEEDGAHVRIIRAVGMTEPALADQRRLPLDASHPIGEALLRAEGLFLEPENGRALAALPLVVEERRLGALLLAFDDRRTVTPEDRAFALALTRLCAQAIDRALLFDAQRAARAAAERARERVSFLAEASTTLAATLDWEATIEGVVRLAVPRLADWCVIDIRADGGGGGGVAVAHVDAGKEGVLREIRRRFPELTEKRDGEELARMLHEIGFEASLVVPLVAHGETVGMLSLGATGPDRAFGPDDVAIAEELAHRAAFAVANARLYADAQAAIRSRDDFLSVASHELRTPLTALQLQLQAVQRRMQGRMPGQDLDGKIDGAMRQVRRLAGLIDALLDISRITAGRLDLQRDDLDIVQTTREVVDRYQDVLTRSGTRIDVHAPESLVGRWDAMRIDQVLTNLISNAIKYGEGKPIRLRVTRADDRAVVAVTDGGIGIASDKLARIFDRFERAVSVRHYGGLGLGLWIVRQIVEAHGGAISVESREGEGSTFTISLPVTPAPAS